MEPDLIIRRRAIGAADLGRIRQLIKEEGAQGRSHLSNRLCELWDWRQANGHFRQIACRDLLRQLEAKGLIELPPRLKAARRAGYRNGTRPPDLLDRVPVQGPLGRLRERIEVRRAQGAEELDLYAGLIGAYHYLGYQQARGAQLKYLAWLKGRPIAALSFGPAAWKIAPRDRWIGWSARAREQRLERIVNNDRFLVLPWARVPRLASFVLSRTLRRLRGDWQEVYRQDVVLAETFIEKDRFSGASYAAANWICVGQTQGRGRNDRFNQATLPIKTVWIYPLARDWQERLWAGEGP